MGRKFIDCREYPSEMNCTLALVPITTTTLGAQAVQHAITVHGHGHAGFTYHDPNCDEGWNAAGRGTAAGGLGVVRPDVC